jgi:hypothetical protein
MKKFILIQGRSLVSSFLRSGNYNGGNDIYEAHAAFGAWGGSVLSVFQENVTGIIRKVLHWCLPD